MSTRPLNFVFILIDDMGWADVACHGSEFHEMLSDWRGSVDVTAHE